MNKLNLLAFGLIMIFSLNGYSQKKENNWQEYKLNGRVKSLTHSQYKAKENFEKIEKGVRIDYIQFIFNKKGNEIEITGNHPTENLIRKWTRKYNEKEEIIGGNCYDLDGNLLRKFIVEYDEKGNKIIASSHNLDGSLFWKSTYKYDKKGNQIEVREYNPNGSLDYKQTYKYDNNGKKIGHSTYNSDEILDGIYTYEYDKKGNMIKFSCYEPDESLIAIFISKYNEKGNMIEGTQYAPDGNSDFKWIYQYQYDNYNNWIKKIEFENGKPQTITERKLEYYE